MKFLFAQLEIGGFRIDEKIEMRYCLYLQAFTWLLEGLLAKQIRLLMMV